MPRKSLQRACRSASLGPGGGSAAKELDVLVRRLAGHGLLEYRAGHPRNDGEDLLVIEPLLSSYWPRMPQLDDADTVLLSRFAYMRRRDDGMVLESPRAGALFRICDPELASLVATLAAPQQIGKLRRQEGFPGLEPLALLVDSQIAFKAGEAAASGSRWAEGDNESGAVGLPRPSVPRPQHRGPARQPDRRRFTA